MNKQICDGYNPKVLMGNWYEQSFSVHQPARDQPFKVARTKQVDIGFIDTKGKLRPLNTVSRLQPWNTSNLVTTCQFDYKNHKPITINKQNYDLGTVKNFHYQFKAQPFSKQNKLNQGNKSYMQVDKFKRQHKLFDEKNCNELLIKRDSDQKSFKSSLKANVHPNHKQYLQSIYQLHISKPGQVLNGQQNKGLNKKVENQSKGLSSFRRIRSQITLKTTTNFPFTNK